MSLNPLERLQLDVQARLLAQSWAGFIPVLTIRPRADESVTIIQTKLDNALKGLVGKNGKKGVTIIIDMPEGRLEYPNAPGPMLEFNIGVRVYENPLVNGGAYGVLRSAEDVCFDVMSTLHHFNCAGQVLSSDSQNPMEPLRELIDAGIVGYACRFIFSYSGPTTAPKVHQPRITVSGALPTVSAAITCSTPGAEIWTSTDGSYPWHGNTSAALYSSPLSITTPCELRAAAYLTDYQSSDLASVDISS